MDLNDFLGPDPIIVDLKAEDRWQAIDELLGHLVAHQKIKPQDKDAIATAVKKRESSMTTGIGFGVGVPHASTDLVSKVVGIAGRSRDGIQFDSLDGNPVRRVFLFLVPQGRFQEYAPALANIAKLLQDPRFRQGLDDS